MTGTTPEYQYHLKDHLGNVRTTFTTQPVTENPIATFETANYNTEQSEFLQYDEVRTVNSTLFDHTNNGLTSYSERLSGSANEKVGIARSISVMPGDTINISVYDKYVDPTNNNNTVALTQFLAQIVAGTASAGTVIDGANYSSNGIMPFPYAGLAGEGSSAGTGPKAFLNYLIFDRNFVFLNGGYVQVTTAAKEDGTNVPFEKLSTPSIVISQPGYVYTYLSNENPSPIEVYFDDFTVQQIKSPVVQQEDFYPFGLSFNSYQRENIVPQNYLYNGGTELRTDLGLNVYETLFRMYDPAIGRFWQIDELTDFYAGASPYSYAYNNPIAFNDPTGLDGKSANAWQKFVGKMGAALNKLGKMLAGKGGPGVFTNKNGTWYSGSRGSGSKTHVSTPRQIARKNDKPNDNRSSPSMSVEDAPQMVISGASGEPTLTHYSPPKHDPPQGHYMSYIVDYDDNFRGSPVGARRTFNDYTFGRGSSSLVSTPANNSLINDLVTYLRSHSNAHLEIRPNVNAIPSWGTQGQINTLIADRGQAIQTALINAGVSQSQITTGNGNVGPGVGNQSVSFTLTNK